MRDALLCDLSILPNWLVTTTHDVRVAPSALVANSLPIAANDKVWAVWEACIQSADAVWMIAPESDGVLTQLTALATQHGKPIIGCGLPAVEIASRKYDCYLQMKQADIPTIPTWYYADWLRDDAKGNAGHDWLAKPNDGAGCEQTYLFEHAEALSMWFEGDTQRQTTHVVQPWVSGKPASISVLSDGRRAHVLSCNWQHITVEQRQLHYAGGTLNGARDYLDVMQALADKVQAALPTLKGYYGIDVIVHPDADFPHEILTLVEINPRLTTSYAALAEAMACNPAELILQALTQENFEMPAFAMHEVHIKVMHDA